MVKDHSDSEKGNPLPPHRLLLSINSKFFFYMHHPTDRIAHTTAFVTPVVEHWLEREIAQWVTCHKNTTVCTEQQNTASLTILKYMIFPSVYLCSDYIHTYTHTHTYTHIHTHIHMPHYYDYIHPYVFLHCIKFVILNLSPQPFSSDLAVINILDSEKQCQLMKC